MTLVGLAANVVIRPEAVPLVAALPPEVALIFAESVAQLLGVKLVVTVPVEPVVPVEGETVAVKPVVSWWEFTLKVTGTPG